MTSGATEILGASKWRALGAALVPIAYPFLLAWGVSTSGHTLADYPALLASGELSPVRQAAGWIAVALFIAVYVPPAITALKAPTFVSTSAHSLFIPSGKKVALDAIKSITFSKTFWHRHMRICGPGLDETVNVTFAGGMLAEMRRALAADPHLRGVKIA